MTEYELLKRTDDGAATSVTPRLACARARSRSLVAADTLRVIDAMAPCRSPSLSCARASHESLLAIEPLLGPSSASVLSMAFCRCSMPVAN